MPNTKIIKESNQGARYDIMDRIYESCNGASVSSGARRGPILSEKNRAFDKSSGDLAAFSKLYEKAKQCALHNAILSDDPCRPCFESAEYDGYEGIAAPQGLREFFHESNFGKLTRPDVRIFPESASGHCVVALYDRDDNKLYPYEIVETKETERVFHFDDGGKRVSIVSESLADAQRQYDMKVPIEERFEERPDMKIEERRIDKIEGPFKVVVETRDGMSDMGVFDDPGRAFQVLVREMKSKGSDGAIVGAAGKEWLKGQQAKEHDVYSANVDQGKLNKSAMKDALKEGRMLVVSFCEDTSMQGVIGSTGEKLSTGQDFVVEKSEDERYYGQVVQCSESVAFVEMKKASEVHPKKVGKAPRIGFSFATKENRPGSKNTMTEGVVDDVKIEENSSEGSAHYRELGEPKPNADGRIPTKITEYGIRLDNKFGITGTIKALFTKDEIEANKRAVRTRHENDQKSYIKIEYIDGSEDKPEAEGEDKKKAEESK